MQAEILFIGFVEQNLREAEQYPSAVFAFDSAATRSSALWHSPWLCERFLILGVRSVYVN